MVKKPNNIADLRNEAGMTQEELAQAVGVVWVTISRIENKPINLRNKHVIKIAEVLGTTPQALINAAGGEQVTVRGAVQAGAWCDHAEWPEEERYDITIHKIAGFEGAPKEASEVRGSSMNELYPDGSIVVWIPFLRRPEEPKPGRRYIVERERFGEYEVTLKEFHVDAQGRKWLIPRTTDPAEKTPLPVNGDDNDTIRLVGRVIWAGRREEEN